MLVYIVKKISYFILMIFLLAVISFSIVYWSPNFSALSIDETYEKILNHAIFVDKIKLDTSIYLIFKDIVMPTFELLMMAFIVSIIIGFPVGIAIGLTNQNKLHHFIRLISLILYASPLIWLTAIIMNLFFSDWSFVASQIYQPNNEQISLLSLIFDESNLASHKLNEHIINEIIAVIILSIQPCIITIDIISQRIEMITHQNYIKIAKIKETSTLKILKMHFLPNITPKVVPQLTYNLTTLLFSVMLIEILFKRAGLGSWLLSAFYQKDYVIIATTFFCSGLMISFLIFLSELFIVLFYPLQARQQNINN